LDVFAAAVEAGLEQRGLLDVWAKERIDLQPFNNPIVTFSFLKVK